MPKCQNLRKAQIYLRYNLLDLLNPLKIYLYILLYNILSNWDNSKFYISNYFVRSLQPSLILCCKDHWLN